MDRAIAIVAEPAGRLPRPVRHEALRATAISLVALAMLAPSLARAQACAISGKPVLAKTVALQAASTGDDAIAKFPGQPIAATMTAAAGRSKLRTGTGSGGFRVEGFVETRDVPVFTTRNVPVVDEHVWIGGGRRVRVRGPASAGVSIEMSAGAPIEQTLSATASCASVSLDQPSFRHPSPPGEARGYLTKKSPLAIAASAGGPAVFTFTSSSIKDALLFWSVEKSGAHVHVMLAGDVVIDGWAAASDLEALKAGEMMDAVLPGAVSISQPRLVMEGAPKTVKVSREVAVRARANDASEVIGAIEAEGEVLVLETVLGWSNVLPTSLAVMPADGRGFWVKATELTAATK